MINVVGLGYIGLPTALMFAAAGNKVIGTDIDHNRVSLLKDMVIPFDEKGMDELLDKAKSNIEFTTEYAETDVYIITVPSPYDAQTKRVDPSYIIDSVKTTLEIANDGSILIVESTVSPGTHDKYVRPLIEEHVSETGETIHLVHAPERILPDNMVYELEYN